jgi:ATP synthase protein I
LSAWVQTGIDSPCRGDYPTHITLGQEFYVPTPDPQKLTELENRIAKMKATTAPQPAKEEHYTMVNMAWRMVIELVAGIAIGFGIGYGLDRLFGTLPVFLILFIGLGFVAGVRTMMRTAQEVQEMHMARAADDKEG